jgi:hypothetical protein
MTTTYPYPPLAGPPEGTSPPAVGDVLYYDGTKWVAGPASGDSIVPTSRQVIAGTGLAGGGALTADVTLSAIATIPDPPAASTGNVTCDATATPRGEYYMAPASDQTFDPATATVSQAFLIIKTTTSTHKITLKATAAWTNYPAGAANTAFDLPGSDTNTDVARHVWHIVIDVPNKIVYVFPST